MGVFRGIHFEKLRGRPNSGGLDNNSSPRLKRKTTLPISILLYYHICGEISCVCVIWNTNYLVQLSRRIGENPTGLSIRGWREFGLRDSALTSCPPELLTSRMIYLFVYLYKNCCCPDPMRSSHL